MSMKILTPEKLEEIREEHAQGIDIFEIIPIVDLSRAKEEAIKRIEKGYIPETYHWTREKTKSAYNYKNYKTWAKSIIVAAKYYLTDEEIPEQGLFGRIARYTWRNNYRYLFLKLKELVNKIEKAIGRSIKAKTFSNYTSIPEKTLFASSGLAEVGKNSLLIHRKMGSYFVIGEALLDLEIGSENTLYLRPPDFRLCGPCTRCIDACPTGAIVEEGAIDINRCFQYISENLLLIPPHLREKWGNRLYGCSTCIEACPYNQNLEPNAEKHTVGYIGQGMNLLEVLALTPKAWAYNFKDNQIAIRDRLAVQKNAIMAIGNSRYEKALDTLGLFLGHEHPLIRIYSAWAIGRIGTRRGKELLLSRFRIEKNEEVRSEIEPFL